MSEAIKIPVIVGFTRPFRLVLRDGDVWDPDESAIFKCQYDYVKLHRLSTNLDVGIAPHSLAIGFDGSLILPKTPKFVERGDAAEQFNSVLGTLLLGGLYSEAVSTEDILFGLLTLDGYYKIPIAGTGSVANFHFAAHTTYLGPLDIVKMLHPNKIQASAFSTAYSEGKSVLANVPTLSTSILLSGVTNYVRHEWSQSLILLWTAMEQIVEHIWNSTITSLTPQIQGRKDFLDDHRSWPTSTRLEMFYQRGLIGDKEYSLVNIARKARNEFIHKGKQPTDVVLDATLDVLCRMISLCMSQYKDGTLTRQLLDTIKAHKRGSVFPNRESKPVTGVTHWLPLPPIPGDSHWGDKEYEVIEELRLLPLPTPTSSDVKTKT